MSNGEQLDKLQQQAKEAAEKIGAQAKEQYEKLSPRAKELGEKAKANPKFKRYAILGGLLAVVVMIFTLLPGGPGSRDVEEALRARTLSEAQSVGAMVDFFGAKRDNGAEKAKMEERVAAMDFDVEITSKKELQNGSWSVNAYVTVTDGDSTEEGDHSYTMREGKKGWRFVND